jgi:drug/metabolite transporter superfamily protein YnfA
MNGLETTVTLGAAVFAGLLLAPRLRMAPPLLLFLLGLVLGFVPQLRGIQLHPETVLLIFLPVMIGLGVVAFALYGFVATLQPDANFGRILAAYGGIFVAGSLAWGMVADGFRPDRYDVIGALICLVGVVVIMYAPRSA